MWNSYIEINMPTKKETETKKAVEAEVVFQAAPVTKKPGYKSTEFYMSLFAVAIGAVVSSGAVEDNEFATKIVGLVMSALVALGYTGSRLTLKKLENDGSGTNSNT